MVTARVRLLRLRRFMHSFWAVIATGLALGASACGDVHAISGVYLEGFEGQVPEDRVYALRLTVFEFESQVGGWMEYYELGALNAPDAPFVLPTHCAYFGPFRRLEDGAVIRVASPLAEEDLQLRFTAETRRHLTATVERSSAIFAPDVEGVGQAIEFHLEKDSPASSCPEQANLIDRWLNGARLHGETRP